MVGKQDRVPVYGIDLLRFLAAVAVVFYHLKPFTLEGKLTTPGTILGYYPETVEATDWAWWGFVGVQIFFVISGVVIGYSAERSTVRSFAISRLTRLWPAMLICAPVLAALNLAYWGHSAEREAVLLLRSLVFWPDGPWVSGQIWTLPIELCFYAVVGVMIASGRIGRMEWLAWALASSCAAFWVAAELGWVQPGRLDALLLLRHGCYFALGIALMRIASAGGFTAGRVLLVALCCASAFREIQEVVMIDFGSAAHVQQATTPFSIWLAAVALVWLSLAWRTPIADFLQTRLPGGAHLLRVLGLATYPLYLIHVQPGTLAMWAGLEAGLDPVLASILGLGAAVFLALLVSLVFEPALARPVRRAATALTNRVALRGRLLAF